MESNQTEDFITLDKLVAELDRFEEAFIWGDEDGMGAAFERLKTQTMRAKEVLLGLPCECAKFPHPHRRHVGG